MKRGKEFRSPKIGALVYISIIYIFLPRESRSMPSCLMWAYKDILVLGPGDILQVGSHLHCTVDHIGLLPMEMNEHSCV